MTKETKTSEPCCQKLGIGEVFKRAWALLVKDVKLFLFVWLISLGIGLVIGIVAFIVMAIFGVSLGAFSGLLSSENFTNYAGLGLFTGIIALVALVIGLISVVIGSWVNGAYVYSIFNAINNKKIEAWECYKLSWKKVWTFVGLGIISTLMIGIGFILFIIPGIILSIYLFYAFYLVVAEDLGAMQAISRSFQLAGKNWLEIFLVVLIIAVAMMILNFIPLINFVAGIAVVFFTGLCSAIMYNAVKK